MAVFRMAEMDFAHKFYLGIDKKFVWCDLEYVFDKYDKNTINNLSLNRAETGLKRQVRRSFTQRVVEGTSAHEFVWRNLVL